MRAASNNKRRHENTSEQENGEATSLDDIDFDMYQLEVKAAEQVEMSHATPKYLKRSVQSCFMLRMPVLRRPNQPTRVNAQYNAPFNRYMGLEKKKKKKTSLKVKNKTFSMKEVARMLKGVYPMRLCRKNAVVHRHHLKLQELYWMEFGCISCHV